MEKDKSTLIRIRYEGTLVRDIEFLRGTLCYQGINLHSGTTFDELENKLCNLGLTLRPTAWLGDGQDCLELGINVASREEVGGDGNEIEWVILSQNFK